MKNLIPPIAFLTLFSCVATKYDASYDQNNFSRISAANKYTVLEKTGEKSVIQLTAVEADSLRGIREKRPVALAKKDISIIKKSQPLATAGLAVGGVFVAGAVIFGLLIKEYSDAVSGQ